MRKNIQKLYIFNSFYVLDPCNQSLKWSLFFRGLIQNLRQASLPLSCEGSPRDLTPSHLNTWNRLTFEEVQPPYMGYIGSLMVKGMVSSSFIWDRE